MDNSATRIETAITELRKELKSVHGLASVETQDRVAHLIDSISFYATKIMLFDDMEK